MALRWIDTHIHVSDIGPDGERRDNLLADLPDVLDRCDADLRLVISPDGPYLSGIARETGQMMAGNGMIRELCAGAPGRLAGSCMINPRFLDEALRMIDVAFGEWGFVQLGEMLPYSMDYVMDSDEAEAAVRRAVEFDVPVQVHMGTYWRRGLGSSGDGMNQMGDLLGIVERVPEAKYILAHAVGCGPTPDYIPWADWFLDAVLGTFGGWPDNFWIEVRDFQAAALPRVIAEVPVTRILAGTDWTTRIGPPFQSYGTMFDVTEDANPFPPEVASFVRFLREAGASDEDIERIAHRNAEQLYGQEIFLVH
ncbi:MAG: amidohydrolase family protein [Armatimonadetes bacterium]|nr:amidohydrolase family protein [Armatimonadota bacterium]